MSGESNSGLVIGLVSDLDDPEGIGRIQVKYPYREDQMSGWARLVTPMGGKQRGLFMRPEVGDEVLIGYEQGDPRRPYVLGAVWTTVTGSSPATAVDVIGASSVVVTAWALYGSVRLLTTDNRRRTTSG